MESKIERPPMFPPNTTPKDPIRSREHGFSRSVKPDQYDTWGFVQDFPLRKHKSEEIAALGSAALRAEWRASVGPVTKFGGIDPSHGHLCSLLFPFCRPERLWLLAYILEFAFLNDDTGMSISLCDSKALDVGQRTGTAKIRHLILKMLYDIDGHCAKAVEKAMEKFENEMADWDKDKSFDSLDEYSAYRVVDEGAEFIMALMCWGMSTQLTGHEQYAVQPLVNLAYASVALTKDVITFEAKYTQFKAAGPAAPLVNAVWLNMSLLGQSEDKAKAAVTQKAIDYEYAFCTKRDELKSMPSMATHNVRRFLDGLTHQVAGSLVWSLSCPRFHAERRVGLDNYLDKVTPPVPDRGLKSKLTPKVVDASGDPNNVEFLVSRGWTRESAIAVLKRSGDTVVKAIAEEERAGPEAAWKLVKSLDLS